MPTPTEVVSTFLSLWDRPGGLDQAIRDYFLPTTVWENVGLATTTGPDEAIALNQGFESQFGVNRIRVETLAIAAVGNPEWGRGLTAPLHLPAVIQDVNARIRRRGDNQLRRSTAQQSGAQAGDLVGRAVEQFDLALAPGDLGAIAQSAVAVRHSQRVFPKAVPQAARGR